MKLEAIYVVFLSFSTLSSAETNLTSYFYAEASLHVLQAFLACVGYKVFFYALKFCDMEPQQFMPAALIGIALYFIKALHIGTLGTSWLCDPKNVFELDFFFFFASACQGF